MKLTGILLLAVILGLILAVTPATAATSVERIPLTAALLQERLDSPLQNEGFSTIDLRQFVIDLTAENAEFRDRFYQQLQTKLNRSQQPLGIDLSESLIQGDWVASRLGLQMPLSQAAISSLLTPTEQQQLQQDERFQTTGQPTAVLTIFRGPIKLSQSRLTGTVDFSQTFFLQRLEAPSATFVQESNWSDARFGRTADFNGTLFGRRANFSRSLFFGKARWENVQFQAIADFSRSIFNDEVNFQQAQFTQLANFTGSLWLKEANLSQVNWRDRVLLSQAHFVEPLSLANATFEKAAAFRGTIFDAPINFQDVKLLDQVDFSNAIFKPGVYLSVAELAFDSEAARILGDTGVIGRVISLPYLEGNETVLRNLVRNFRNLEQIADANQIEYTTERLRLQRLGKQILDWPIAQIVGLSQGETVLQWLGLSLLLLLSDYGTNFELVFGTGLAAIAYFGLLFWLIDRWRRRFPVPILPNRYEILCMLSSFTVLTLVGVTDIFRNSHQPWLTLACLGFVLVPIPLFLVSRLYQQGRYHNLLDVSYFVEDGSMRQLRLLIVRLPIIPRFVFFRDRYEPILWERRWNWLNYYDLSLNNFIKLGFNDIRLRDRHLPGLISILVWYQWSLGILYVALLLWTLSRTIPGLNLLIYLK